MVSLDETAELCRRHGAIGPAGFALEGKDALAPVLVVGTMSDEMEDVSWTFKHCFLEVPPGSALHPADLDQVLRNERFQCCPNPLLFAVYVQRVEIPGAGDHPKNPQRSCH